MKKIFIFLILSIFIGLIPIENFAQKEATIQAATTCYIYGRYERGGLTGNVVYIHCNGYGKIKCGVPCPKTPTTNNVTQ